MKSERRRIRVVLPIPLAFTFTSSLFDIMLITRQLVGRKIETPTADVENLIGPTDRWKLLSKKEQEVKD